MPQKSNNNHHVMDHDDRRSVVKTNNNKKSVRFAKNLVQACEVATPKPSKEEKHLLYYSRQELKAIKEEIVITVKLARRSSKEIFKQTNKNSSGGMSSSTVDDMMMITSEIILCTRGLEHIIDSDLAKERRTRISKVRETIMLVQVANFYENPIADHFESSSSSSSISCSCRSWTRKSQKEAYIRGLADRAMVDMYGSSSSIMTSTKPSSTKKKKGKKIVAPLKHSSREIAKSLSSLNLRNKESSKQSLVVVRAPSA